jgi:hypothetical protein
LSKVIGKVSPRLSYKFYKKTALTRLIERHNIDFNIKYIIHELFFPKSAPYGWHNYPYDYYNIWVKMLGIMSLWKNRPLKC